MPKMKHPRSTQTLDVAPSQVPMYESQGWYTVAPAKRAQKKTTMTTSTRTTEPAATATTEE